MITNTSNYNTFSSLNSIIDKYANQYDDIDFVVIDENIWFIIRPISRNEYRKIYNDTIMSNPEKKDIICKKCILYPTNFDFDNCAAGIPEQLYERIMEISYLELDSIISLIEINRSEMELLEHQMLCIISKMFPCYKYEEIENMNMIQICKLFTRAEWMFKNLNNSDYLLDIIEVTKNAISKNNDNDINTTNNIPNKQEDLNEKPVSKMTDEQRQALDDFYRKFPEFKKENDYVYTGKIYHEFKDPPALRPRGRR